MPRIRSIKPEFWDDQKMARLTHSARLVYMGIWNYSDDYAVCRAEPVFLKSKIFPYENISMEKFNSWLKELKDLKRLKPFSSNGESYFYLPHFKDHQRISHPAKTNYPSYFPEGSGKLPEGSGKLPEGSGKLGSRAHARDLEGEGDMDMDMDREGEGVRKAIPKKISSSPLPPIPKGLEFKVQDDLKRRLAETRDMRRKLADKEFLKNSPASHNDLLCQLKKKEKKYRELIEDYS